MWNSGPSESVGRICVDRSRRIRLEDCLFKRKRVTGKEGMDIKGEIGIEMGIIDQDN